MSKVAASLIFLGLFLGAAGCSDDEEKAPLGATGDPCAEEADCAPDYTCMGTVVDSTCQPGCDPAAETNSCPGAGECLEFDPFDPLSANRHSAGVCTCVPGSCGDLLCLPGFPHNDLSFCGTCSNEVPTTMQAAVSTVCCGPSTQCEHAFAGTPAGDAGFATCHVAPGASEGRCAVRVDVGINAECVEHRDCQSGEQCRAAMDDDCTSRGLTEASCLACFP